MKKWIVYLVLLTVTFAACKKEDTVFDKSPDERINGALASYQQTLQSAASGWKATITAGTGGIYNFHFRFADNNRVFMYSDFNVTTAGTEKESSYRLKALQQPVLIFDTYSYIHLLGDPDGNVNGGADGEGLLTDFEFAIDTVYADSIILTGRYYQTHLRLERAEAADYTAWQNGVWESNVQFQNISNILEYFKRFTLGGVTYDIIVDPITRTVSFIWFAGNAQRSFTTTYYFDRTGVVLTNPFVNGTTTIRTFTDIKWNATTRQISMQVNSNNVIVAGANAPIRVDLNAPQRWYNTVAASDEYWGSYDGFHVNGVDDAYKVTQIPGYAFMVFWPAFGSSGGTTYDLLGFVTQTNAGLTLGFGAGYNAPTFTSDGKIVFTVLGVLGDVPTEAEDAFYNTASRMTDPSGYYLVQTGSSSYDMVAASNARAWIHWER